MRYLVPVPLQYVDQSGIPYSGGSVSVHYEGNDTLAPIYENSHNDELAQNPSVLDSNGMWKAFVDAGVSLDYIVKNSEGNVVATFWGVVAAGGNGGGTGDVTKAYVDENDNEIRASVDNLAQDLADEVDRAEAAENAIADIRESIEDLEENSIKGVKVNGTELTPDANKKVNVAVPTSAADVNALPASTKYAASISLTVDTSTFVCTAQLKDQDGNNIGNSQSIDLPLESVVVSGSYDDTTKKVILTLQNGSTVEFSVADLVDGLLSENGDGKDLTVTYTAQSSGDPSNISSGSTLSTIFAKIQYWFTKFGTLAWKSEVEKSDLANGVQSSLDKADSALQGVKLEGANNPLTKDAGGISTIPNAVPTGNGATNGLMTSEDKAVVNLLKSANEDSVFMHLNNVNIWVPARKGTYDVPIESVIIGGRAYPIVQIGNQLWTAENLRTESIGTLGIDYFYPYDNQSNVNRGFLYKLSSLFIIPGESGSGELTPKQTFSDILPTGWHVPSEQELYTLFTSYSNKLTELRSNNYWTIPGTNETGLGMIPAGLRTNSGSFDYLNTRCYLWSSSWKSSYTPGYYGRACYLENNSYSTVYNSYTGDALSIRLVKNLA